MTRTNVRDEWSLVVLIITVVKLAKLLTQLLCKTEHPKSCVVSFLPNTV